MNRRNSDFRKGLFLAPTLTVALLFSTAQTSAQSFVLSLTFADPTPTDGDKFGRSIAMERNHVLIGDPFDATTGYRVGQAYLFDATSGSLLRPFDAPTPTTGDPVIPGSTFGWSVALDGNYVLIGASMDYAQGPAVGQAHLFDALTGNLLQTFDDPTPTDQDYFGRSVALGGNRVLISAPFDDTNGYWVGQTHLFNATTGNLLQTFDEPTPTDQSWFGSAVALNDDRVLIGAPGDSTNGSFVGQAHLFNATTGSLLQTFDEPTPSTGDETIPGSFFGVSVALDGPRVLIGASFDSGGAWGSGQAHLFDATTGSPLQTFDDPTPTEFGNFGWSVAIDENRVLIGGSAEEAHLFDATTGELLHTFAGHSYGAHGFGHPVAIDGTRILIGASEEVYLFTWVPEPSNGLLLFIAAMGLALLSARNSRTG